jgi:hypothetical protein
MSTPYPTTYATMIAANLDALYLRLRQALKLADDSRLAMADGKQNLAIGTIVDLERVLPECEALYRTILILHRSRDSFEQNEVRS